MGQKAFVCFVALNDGESLDSIHQAKLSFQHFSDNITDEQIRKGLVEFPDGDGEFRLLPALVEK